MRLILNIETSGKNCSVAIAEEGKVLVLKELFSEKYMHSEQLHLFISDCFEELEVGIEAVIAVAVSEGPGSYTGLRIGVSTAKGLAYALGVPLIAVSSLMSLAIAAKLMGIKGVYCPMIDARRMEVYTCFYNSHLEPLGEVTAAIIDTEFDFFEKTDDVFYFGDGAEKCKPILPKNFKYVPSVSLSASNMTDLSYFKFVNSDFVDLAYFEPFYLKDFIPGKPKKMF